MPRSTLSNWFSGLDWSQELKSKLTEKARYTSKRRFLRVTRQRSKYWEGRKRSSREEAKTAFPSLLKDPLFISGISIYWGEGDSKLSNGNLRISNTDPKMIIVFLRFLRETLTIANEKIRIGIILYPDLDEGDCLDFWQKETRVPRCQFHKTQFITGRHPTKRSERGICMVSVCDRMIKEKVGTWIEMLGERYSRV